MPTPNDFKKTLGRLRFTSKIDKLDDVEEFTSPNGKLGVNVFSSGDWWLEWEEVRKKGKGLPSLLRVLKGFQTESKGIRETIRELVDDEIEEMTATGDAQGFGTPLAFDPDEESSLDEQFERVVAGMNEGGDPYYAWRNDETATPKMKIGRAISEINKQLTEMAKVVKRSARLKTEMGVPNSDLWKRTNASLMKIEQRMTGIAQQIRGMRG